MTTELWLGLATEIVFGALLQVSRAPRFEKQIGAMLFRDMTIFKFMLSAVIVGMVGINLLVALGLVALKIKKTLLAANLIGGAIFGVGWAVGGYCPGTSIAAMAEGRWHAIWAIAGMLAGAAAYAEVYPALQGNVLFWGNCGALTLPGLLGVSVWLLIPVLIAGFAGLCILFEKRRV